MKAERDNTDGYIAGIDYLPAYAKAFPNNCAVIEKTGDGKSIGACTFFLFQENHTVCPRHGKVKRDTTKPDLSITEVASLLREVISMHADPASAEYNMCDSAPCNWCERAQKVCDALTPITPCPYCGGNCVPGQCDVQHARTDDCHEERPAREDGL